jgi:hypothetical protein
MPFIGNKPSAIPLTSADIADSIITSAKIVDGTIVNADINASAGIVTSKLSGALGITMSDMWRLTATLNSNATPISSNLERIDTTGQGTLGTGMTESSGIFSFPSTGIYLVRFNFNGEVDADGFNTNIELTTNNSTYVEITQTSVGDGANYNVSGTQETFIDVTDISNVKVRFKATSMAGNINTQIYGNTSLNYTTFTFIRLGDT